MPRFIQILQIVLAVVIGSFIGYDLILHGISIFNEKYVTITCVLWLISEITLFVIYKLIEDDQSDINEKFKAPDYECSQGLLFIQH